MAARLISRPTAIDFDRSIASCDEMLLSKVNRGSSTRSATFSEYGRG